MGMLCIEGGEMFRSLNIWRVSAVVAVVLLVAGAAAWYAGVLPPLRPVVPANAIMIIEPYRYAGTWVFDDPAAGLSREPFVGGVPEMIDELVKDIPNAEEGFRLLFSARPFPGYSHKLVWRRSDGTGNWYYCPEVDREGWLCPALLKYYRKPPKEIYVKAEAKQ